MPDLMVPAPGAAGGIRIAYETVGHGAPIMLVHGFASNRQTNWIGPGWYEFLTKAGRQVIALDCRGHGASAKPHNREAYDERLMAGDIRLILDALGIERADFMGYSMGGYLGMRALADFPERLGKVVLAGVGLNYLAAGAADPQAIAAALLGPSLAAVTAAVPRQFRQFAERSGNDLAALGACMLRPRASVTAKDLAGIRNAVLVIAGDKDLISGPPEPLARIIPNARSATIPGKDHMLAVGDMSYKRQVLEFLNAP
jgi:pimeloyl-ACP methyl ester carboxylesterase